MKKQSLAELVRTATMRDISRSWPNDTRVPLILLLGCLVSTGFTPRLLFPLSQCTVRAAIQNIHCRQCRRTEHNILHQSVPVCETFLAIPHVWRLYCMLAGRCE